MALGLKKPALGWSRYRDMNPVPTSPLADDTTTAPSGPVVTVSMKYVCVSIGVCTGFWGVRGVHTCLYIPRSV